MPPHHYIPRFHLKLFAQRRDPGHVWRYDKEAAQPYWKIRRVSIDEACAIENYYAIPDQEGAADDQLERALAQLESEAAGIVRRICEMPLGTHELPDYDRFILSQYLASLYVRGPSSREPMTAVASLLGNAEFDMMITRGEFVAHARKSGMQGTDEELAAKGIEIQDDLRSGTYHLQAPIEWSLMSLQAAFLDIAPILAMRRWIVLRRQQMPYYVLGDQPISIRRPPGLNPHRGAGIATPGVEIFCPLSPGSLLAIPDEPALSQVEVLGPVPRHDAFRLLDGALEANRKAWWDARQYVIGRSQADLEFTRLSFDPEEMDGRPYQQVTGLPKEWHQFLSDEIRVVEPRSRRKPETQDDPSPDKP